MSLRLVTQKLKTQSLADMERAMDEQDDSGSESDDERGVEDDQEEVSLDSSTLLRSTRSRLVTSSHPVTSSRLVTSPQPVSDAKSVLSPSSPCDIIGDDNYSSEEELKEINVKRKYCQRVDPQKYTEKRKWSEMSIDDEDRRSEQLPRSPHYVVRRGSSGGSSEGLPTPVQFCTSPPLDVYRPGRSQSPPQKLFHLVSGADMPDSSTASTGTTGSTEDQDEQRHSPSKRHRLTPRPQRPCLDFEKMQQIKKRVVTSWRPQGTELSLFCW